MKKEAPGDERAAGESRFRLRGLMVAVARERAALAVGQVEIDLYSFFSIGTRVLSASLLQRDLCMR